MDSKQRLPMSLSQPLDVAVHNEPHQCLKVVDTLTLWLLNPLKGDFRARDKSDQENYTREVADALRTVEPHGM
jgi:hypothetical protein